MTWYKDKVALDRDIPLAFERALSDGVADELRGVSVDWDEREISGIFVYDRPTSEADDEWISDIEGEVIAHFPDHVIQLEARSLPPPHNLEGLSRRAWVYRRPE